MDVDINYFFKGLKDLARRVAPTPNNITQQDRSRALNVLLIEDNDACIYLTRRAFQSSSHAVTLNVMHDYEGLISFLRKQTPSLPFPHPDIIILDLNLPKVDGISILREIKQDDALSDIPVIILSNNTKDKDMITCYQEQASGYMYKPFDVDVFETNIHILVQYWSQTVVLPKRQNEVLCKSA
jgi:two-component system response regulator